MIDTDPNTPEIEHDCQVYYQSPCTTLGMGYCQQTGWAVKPLSECKDAQGKILDPRQSRPQPF